MDKRTTELKWALIFTVMMLLWMVIERVSGLHGRFIDQHAIYTNFVAIPAIIIYVLALREKRDKDLGGLMSWPQGFVAGLIMSLIIMVLTPVTQWLTHEVISPQYFTNVIAYAVDNGMMTNEEAQAYFSLKNYLIQSVIGALIMGTVTSAIVAIFVRRSA